MNNRSSDEDIKNERDELRKSLAKINEKKGKKEDLSNEDTYRKGTKPHKSAVIGDTVGDPLKDTSGPSLNILIKLSAIVSLIFGSYFAQHSIFNF